MNPRVYLDPLPTYLTGSSNRKVRDVARAAGLGILLGPGTGYRTHAADYAAWAADNGQFTTTYTPITEGDWWSWLREAVTIADPAACLFANAPDVLHFVDGAVVGDAAATLARSRPWLPRIRGLGVPAALVAQDGAERLDLPWDEFDVLFLGGSTEWKLGPHAHDLTRRALAHDRRVHMGRVNSLIRLKRAASWGVASVDGTYLGFGPDKNLPRLLSWYGIDLAEIGGGGNS